MRLRDVFLCGFVGVALACSSVDVGGGGPGVDGGEIPDGQVVVSGDAAPQDDAGKPAVTFKIQFDYRFDTKGFFSDTKRRAALEGAARIWGTRIKTGFANVPKDTFILVRDPEHPKDPAQSFNIDYEIDDIVVFVGSSELGGGTLGLSSPTFGLSGVTNTSLASSLQARQKSVPFQPWTAWISFDENSPWFFDDTADSSAAIPSGQMDFVSVALHELGHVLGFGTADPFKAFVVDGKFTGAKAVGAFGGPVPLVNGAHFPNDILGADRPLMDVSDALGTRYVPKPLDIAVFQDLGYTF